MSIPSTGNDVYQVIKNHLDNHGMHYEEHVEDLAISLIAKGDDLPQPTVIRVLAEKNVVMIYSPIPGSIPEARRIDAAVAVTIANYGMINGHFELDMTDGTIRFKISQGYHDIEFSDKLIEYMLALTFFTTDKYNDKFFALGMGLLSLEKFVEMTESR